jgi:transcriptional regulator PpsR
MSKGRQASLEELLYSPVAARVVAATADLALILDRDGVILEVSLGAGVDAHPGWARLVGMRWADTLSRESQEKVAPLLAEVRDGRTPRAREFNQKVEGVGEILFRFNVVLLDDAMRMLVLGRDLRPLTTLQQRMIGTQQAMDREYGRLRQADTRYRVLFHVASEGVVIADGASRRILEVNPAASAMLGEPAAALQGKSLVELFDPLSRPSIDAVLAALEGGAKPADIQANLSSQPAGDVTVSPSLFRQGGSPLVLLRMSSVDVDATSAGSRASRMLAMLDAMPDGFVVTGEDRRILSANTAFCDLVQHANENQVIGEPLDRWLGRPGVDLSIMMANLREHGTVRNFATIVRGDFATPQEALVTAVSALAGKVRCLGFMIRSVTSFASAPSSSVLPRSVEQLRNLVGRVSLKELVRESADLIERLCIEAALDVSGNNRASAAQLLGLSRQGLYSKLRRYGLGEFDPT